MKKAIVLLFIVLDLGLMAGAGIFAWRRAMVVTGGELLSLRKEEERVLVPPFSGVGTPLLSGKKEGADPLPPEQILSSSPDKKMKKGNPSLERTPKRKSGRMDVDKTFILKDAHVKDPAIVGDFNGWTPKPFKKMGEGERAVTISLKPGDYSYNFLLDGKTVRDPREKRTDDHGRSFVSVAGPK